MIYVLSGGANLNFKVVGGTTQPSSPAENTIWVNTSTAITSYVFSPTQPTGSDGMVWISTGLSSSAEFNALKKNNITVRPTGCKQYINGAWQNKVAEVYQGGWKSLILYLYTPGNTCDSVTGGYVAEGKIYSTGGGYVSQTPTVTKSGTEMTIVNTARYGYGITYTKNKISLAGKRTLRFKGSYSKAGDNTACLTVWSSIDATYSGSNRAAFVWLENNGAQDISLDVSSLDGEYYIGFITGAGYNNNITLTVTELWAEG